MRAIRTWGSVRGVLGDWYPYRDRGGLLCRWGKLYVRQTWEFLPAGGAGLASHFRHGVMNWYGHDCGEQDVIGRDQRFVQRAVPSRGGCCDQKSQLRRAMRKCHPVRPRPAHTPAMAAPIIACRLPVRGAGNGR
jgi:hypothetical protein